MLRSRYEIEAFVILTGDHWAALRRVGQCCPVVAAVEDVAYAILKKLVRWRTKK